MNKKNTAEEKLDSPLVVHKKGDASFQETANELDMSLTHDFDRENELPTLQRHRFKKKKKGSGRYWWLVAFIAVAVAVVSALVYSGVISFEKDETTTKPQRTYVSTTENRFKGVITVKGTYVFFEGKEVDGLKGLESEVKYLGSGTKLVIQDENAEENFLNLDVLSLLTTYKIDYTVKHIVSSGLVSKYETTTEAQKAASQEPSSESRQVGE